MPTYQVNMDQVEYIVGEMAAITQRIQQTVAQLDQQSGNDLANWDSETRMLYSEQKQVWDTTAEHMHNSLTKAVHSLGNINEFYRLGERQGANIWQH